MSGGLPVFISISIAIGTWTYVIVLLRVRGHFYRARLDPVVPHPATPDSPEMRAQQLLGRLLGPEELKRYQVHHKVFVTSSKGKRWEVRNHGATSQKTGHRYCVFPLDNAQTPVADQVLTLALHLMSNEGKFVHTANRQ